MPDREAPKISRCRWCGEPFIWEDAGYFLCSTPEHADRQLKHALRGPEDAGGGYLYVPTPAQVELRECKTKKLLWGGAAGGAKSHGLRWDAYFWCMTIPNYECLLMRRSYPELESTHLLRMERDQASVGAKYDKMKRMMIWPNGSFIKAGHCESKSDLTKLLSTEYDDVRIDEGSTFEGELTREISSRARSAKPDVKARGGAVVRIGSNPGGRGAVFLKDFYIDKNPDPQEFPDYDPIEYTFIPARISDNPYLDDTYESELKQLDADRRRQLLDGDWTVFVGQFFSKWQPERRAS